MNGRVLILSVIVAACVGASAPGQDQQGYTIPAREQLLTGTLSGLTEAYRILDRGVTDVNVAGDRRELLFLHALARTGMLVFDRNDVAVNTSLLEIAQPFGILVTGDRFFSVSTGDPDRVQVHVPTDPADSNCLLIPPGADVEAAAEAMRTAILPEIDRILLELAGVTDAPAAFGMTLAPSETGSSSAIEVDYGDVLSFRAALLLAKAFLHGLGKPAYDLSVDPNDPLFAGWQCGLLPEGTTINAILDAYPDFLKILPETGKDSLSEARQRLITALDGVLTAMDYMSAETDDPADDLLHLNDDDPRTVAVRSELDKLRTSLATGKPGTYTRGYKESFTLDREEETVGQMVLDYDLVTNDGWGWIEFKGLGDFPDRWQLGWIEIHGDEILGDAEIRTDDNVWWGWFEGTISPDGSQITDLAFEYQGGPDMTRIDGLTARRTSQEPTTVPFDPNPVLAGAVGPRDMLPRFDANDMPVAGTFGHGLGDDPALGGVFPGMTQDDWLGSGYEVYGVPDVNALTVESWPGSRARDIFRQIDQRADLFTRLGASPGRTATFSGSYPMYIVAARDQVLVDSIHGPGQAYLGPNDPAWITDHPSSMYWQWNWYDELSPEAITGSPDGRFAAVGGFGLLERFTGWAIIRNPGDWTGVTVVTLDAPMLKAPVYRFWSPVNSRHFYTISDLEKQNLIDNYSHVWTYEGIAYHVPADGSDPNSRPVHRFWSGSLKAHFYTIEQSEKDKLIEKHADVWAHEGVAFHAYPKDRPVSGTSPVYRFWSETLSCHFYTISEAEKDHLIANYPHVWIYEGVAWHAYP